MKSIDKKNIIVVVLLIILGVLVTLFFLQRKDYSTIIGQLNTEKDSIRTELLQMLAENDSIKTDNEILNENLLVTQTRIKDLIYEIEQCKKIG
jgi:regulator of replication initiation timing